MTDTPLPFPSFVHRTEISFGARRRRLSIHPFVKPHQLPNISHKHKDQNTLTACLRKKSRKTLSSSIFRTSIFFPPLQYPRIKTSLIPIYFSYYVSTIPPAMPFLFSLICKRKKMHDCIYLKMDIFRREKKGVCSYYIYFLILPSLDVRSVAVFCTNEEVFLYSCFVTCIWRIQVLPKSNLGAVKVFS